MMLIIFPDDYVIIWRGGYDHITDENDQRLRILVLEDNTVDVKSKGNITFEITNLLSGDNSTCKYVLQNYLLSQN